MNTGIFVVVLLVFFMFSAMLVAIIYYVRHWAQRQQRFSGEMITEGAFFKRYIPAELRDSHDQRRQQQAENIRHRITNLRLVISAIAGGGVLVIAVFAVLENWDKVTWIDLSDQEIAALNYTHNHWLRQVDGQLPKFDGILPSLRKNGVVLVGAADDALWREKGRSAAKTAMRQWIQFLDAHDIRYRNCTWDNVLQCPSRGVYIVLPGQWSLPVSAKLLHQGANLLFYGPPAQAFAQKDYFEFYGMRFYPRSVSPLNQLAIVGDQQLTLGFDAGQIIAALPAFEHYVVQSSNPQAVAIGDDRFIGGELRTRLYARTVDAGRLVWMDFSPNVADQPDSINLTHLEALNAAVFRFLLHRSYSAWATWPDGRRFAGMLSEDTEADFDNASRVMALVEKYKIPFTWFILANEAQQHRTLTRRLAAVGEVACHGDSHASFPSGDRATQIQRIARCQKVLTKITGVVPLAFRPPSEEYSDDTIDAIANNAMTHYAAEAGGDRAVPVLVRSLTTGKTLVSLPRIGADDYELWHKRRLGYRASIDRADQEFLWAAALGGFLMFDFHSQLMNTEHLSVVEHFAQRLQQEDVFLGTSRDISDWWNFRSQLIHGSTSVPAQVMRFHPVLLAVRPDGQLLRITEFQAQQQELAVLH